jgi:glycerol-3-phosphate O-acyltransferase / dihydroxyacetone phosphate acyltransferase
VIYRFTQALMLIFLRLYYKTVYLNTDRIPGKVPCIIASNHTNAFMDPILIGYRRVKKVKFFARGDVFRSPVAAFFLKKLGILPMYRLQEGFSEIKKNAGSFDSFKLFLENRETILLYPEGICIQDYRIKPLKKGLAKVALDFAINSPEGSKLAIVPLGMNFYDPSKFRSSLIVYTGDAFSIEPWIEPYKKNPAIAINDLTAFTEKKMRETVAEIQNPENDVLFRELWNLFEGKYPVQNKLTSRSALHIFNRRQLLARSINGKSVNEQDEFKRIKESALTLSAFLKERKILPKHLFSPPTGIFTSGLQYLFLIPFFYSGWLLNLIPVILGVSLTRKKVKNIEFYASVEFVLCMLFWIFWALLGFSLAWLLSGSLVVGLFVVVGLAILGQLSITLREPLRSCKSALEAWKFRDKAKGDFENKREEGERILNFFFKDLP